MKIFREVGGTSKELVPFYSCEKIECRGDVGSGDSLIDW